MEFQAGLIMWEIFVVDIKNFHATKKTIYENV